RAKAVKNRQKCSALNVTRSLSPLPYGWPADRSGTRLWHRDLITERSSKTRRCPRLSSACPIFWLHTGGAGMLRRQRFSARKGPGRVAQGRARQRVAQRKSSRQVVPPLLRELSWSSPKPLST